MSLDITEKRVGVALSNHPSPNNIVRQIDPIPYITRKLCPLVTRAEEKDRVGSELERIIRDHRVCALVVGWPLLPDGRPGGHCGKSLHLLDHLAGECNGNSTITSEVTHTISLLSFAEFLSKINDIFHYFLPVRFVEDRRWPIISKARPFALWDERDIPRDLVEEGLIESEKVYDKIDRWGRSPVFCRTPTYEIGSYIYRSGSQFCHKTTDDSAAASMILKHFLDSHWTPKDINTKVHFNGRGERCQFNHAVDGYPDEDEKLYIQSSLL